ncbi:hypothetical protein ACQ856_25220 [Mycolicibacterium psychrotolerans]|uniref:hypothetical protein n=1 Tax=Mycolicibacterium psychrotolerans TaxID=216929 RepID=UPI003D6703A1
MYLSAERLALANQAVRETFEQCSIAWQAVPHWDTGDPGQINVPDGIVATPNVITVQTRSEPFELTLGEAIAPTPDALLTGVASATKTLAKDVDDDILQYLYTNAGNDVATALVTPQPLLNALVDARVYVEDAGYRAPSCLITNTEGYKKLSHLVGGVSILPQLLTTANIDSLYRTKPLNAPDANTRFVLIGRRRRIPQGAAPEASPGEEPVDVAISLWPSVQVDGELPTGKIQLTVRVRYALRITDDTGVVRVHNP